MADQPFDLLISGGTLLDGESDTPVRADVGIVDARVAEVGDLADRRAARTIDAAGLRVAPGFIDIHTHSDISVVFNPTMESMVSQGVTTQVVGNCALSLACATGDDIFAFEKRWLAAHGARITWGSVGEHLRSVADHGVATNYLTLAGQGTLRKRVMGMDHRPPAADEMESMKAALQEALEQGAWGVSTGLEYTPSGYANVDELSELSLVVARCGGFYATHLRNEGDTLVESVAEALEIGERAGVPVQLSHHKSEGRHNWGKVHTTLRMVEEARARGMDVQMDQYPYTAFQTSLAVQFLPGWANMGDNEAVLRRLSDPDERRAVLADMRANHPDWASLETDSPWEHVIVASARYRRELQGRSIADIAREEQADPLEQVLDIILGERNFVSGLNFAISEEDIVFVMRHPLTMVGSDAVGTSPSGRMGQDRVHPRCYGTFPRVLGHYARERGVLEEGAAIRKMTSLPADRLGIGDRGRLKPGMYADVVLYDPAAIIDNATFAEPHQFATGIDTVLVNGQAVWRGGAHTGALPGRVLRRTGQVRTPDTGGRPG